MAKVPKKIGQGEGGNGVSQLEKLLTEEVDDLNELRNQFIALLQKLDADGALNDTDYEASLTPNELKTTK